MAESFTSSSSVAVITGAASGIGRAAAIRFAQGGHAIVVADMDLVAASTVVAELTAQGHRALAVRVDVTDAAHLRSMFEVAAQELGRIEFVLANAGIMTGAPDFPDASPEQVARVVAVNLTGVMHTCQLALPHLRRDGGSIVCTASTAALGPLPGDPIYAATKAGVASFVSSCAGWSDRYGVRVNAILPGMVDTPIVAKTGDGTTPAAWLAPALRVLTMLQPEEIAEAMYALATDPGAAGSAVTVLNPERRN
jgi:NAD(P)-dependent dehydrogenase (short-subunit alcohol dehydrogenase family)